MRLAAACRRLPALVAAALVLCGMCVLPEAMGAGTVLVGSATVSGTTDSNGQGTAEAFKAVASASGTTSQVSVYVDAASTAGSLQVGLYSAGATHPAALLASGSISAPTPGAWNSVTLSKSVAVSGGTAYWIAILAPQGRLRFRDAAGSGKSETSRSPSLSRLPSTWSTGKVYSEGQLSAYASASAVIDTTAPSAPTGLGASSITQTTASFSWTAATDNVGVTGYTVYLNGVPVGSTTTLTSYGFSSLVCGTSYTLGVDATDASGNRSARSTLGVQMSACTADATAPTVPPNERFTSITPTNMTLAWDPSTDDVGVAGYRLYLNDTLVSTTPSLSYTYSGLTCGTTYKVAITAFDAAGNASNPAFSTGFPATSACAADATAPSAPTGLTVSGISAGGGSLSWAASSDNVAVTGYRLLLNNSPVGTTGSLSYGFTGLACGTSYTLGVDAYDAAGNHSAAASATLVTGACAPASGDAANLFVDSNGGTCARAATPSTYVDANACGSFNAAYQAARPGDVVKVQSGSYGSITIAQKAGSAAPNVVFQPAQGASVSFNTIGTGDVNNNTPGGNYWTIQGPMTGHGADITLANHVTLDGLTLDGGYASNDVMYISAADSVTLSHMNICCSTDQKLIMTDAYRGPTTNLTITDSVLHDQRQTVNTVHMECFFANGIQGLTIRRTVFRGCKSTGDMLITQSGTAPQPSNTLIENSIFETATDANGATVPYTIQTQTPNVLMPFNNFRFLYNLFQSPPDLQGGTGNPNAILTGNIGAFTSCPASTYSHNIWTAVKCGTTDIAGSGILNGANFVNVGAHDWHYTSSNPAINDGDPASYPATDLDNHGRYVGTAPDVGPYEYGSH